MKTVARSAFAMAMLGLAACGSDAQQSSSLVRSSDRELGALASALLPDLARRSGLELKEPVRLEMRSRAELQRYLEHKLDEEVPADEARATVASYALLGLVPDTLDLRRLLMGLYTEQVAGFYEPDSTALFILDDQPATSLQPLLIHELVHAVQDQSVDLGALTDPDLGNDRARAAQAAIEGHATLVMLEFLTEQMRGAPVDLATVPDFGSTLRPSPEAMQAQFPALAGAPRVLQEALLFPYVEGAGYVQHLWARGDRVAPFGRFLPLSSEQVVTRDLGDLPLRLSLEVEGAATAYEDTLGRLELRILLETHAGSAAGTLSEGWGGDGFALIDVPGGGQGLALVVLWDDLASRDAFVGGLAGRLSVFPRPATLEPLEVDGHPGALLRVGVPATVRVRSRLIR
jgi:hypothetical protein